MFLMKKSNFLKQIWKEKHPMEAQGKQFFLMYIFKKSYRVRFIHYVSLGFGFVGFFSFRFLTAKREKSWHTQGTKSNHQTSTAKEAAPRNHLFCREVHRILSAVKFGIGGSPSNKL